MTTIFNDKMNLLSDALRELSILEPKEIAKKLKDEGIQGKARACTFCPIANYLHKTLGEVYFVTHQRVYILDRENAFDYDEDVYVDTPESVRTFVKQFDAGKYLFLDEGKSIE